MGNVTASGIWTPGELEGVDPEVWSAAMAESIENGIGDRLTKQETAIGLKAGLPASSTVSDAAGQTAPYQIMANLECFTQGLTLDGGFATVATAGMYLVSCSAALETIAVAPGNENRSIALQIYKNGTMQAGSEVDAGNRWQTAQNTCVLNAIPGDTLSVRWYSAGPVNGVGVGTLADQTALHTLSIVLVTPIGA